MPKKVVRRRKADEKINVIKRIAKDYKRKNIY